MNYVDPKWTIPPSPVPLWTTASVSLMTVPKDLYDRIAVLEAENARLHAELQVAQTLLEFDAKVIASMFVERETPPTKGETLANALRSNAAPDAYGR